MGLLEGGGCGRRGRGRRGCELVGFVVWGLSGGLVVEVDVIAIAIGGKSRTSRDHASRTK